MKEPGYIYLIDDFQGVTLTFENGMFYINQCYKGWRCFCKAQVGYREYEEGCRSLSIPVGSSAEMAEMVLRLLHLQISKIAKKNEGS